MIPFGQIVHPPCLIPPLPAILSTAPSDISIPWNACLLLYGTPIQSGEFKTAKITRAGAEVWTTAAEVSPPGSLSSGRGLRLLTCGWVPRGRDSSTCKQKLTRLKSHRVTTATSCWPTRPSSSPDSTFYLTGHPSSAGVMMLASTCCHLFNQARLPVRALAPNSGALMTELALSSFYSRHNK